MTATSPAHFITNIGKTEWFHPVVLIFLPDLRVARGPWSVNSSLGSPGSGDDPVLFKKNSDICLTMIHGCN
jgi:hypothetical protein